MFDHVTIRASDRDAGRRFYELALGDPTYEGEYVEWGAYGLTEGEPTRRLHVGFGVAGRAAVDEWWLRLTGAGYASDGEPGPRPEYNESYYGAFVLDPDGNSVEAMHYDGSVAGEIDHLWLRTRDVVAARRFYLAIAPVVGLRLAYDSPGNVRFSDGTSSVSFVSGGQPTERVHVAFGVPDRATVDAFHAAALSAGFADNGAPGERPEYHPGYYGAFVLDPDGHNIEAVFHDRR